MCVLKDKPSGEILSTKTSDIITYFIAKRTNNFDEVITIAGLYVMDINEKAEEFRNTPLIVDYIPLSHYYILSQNESNKRIYMQFVFLLQLKNEL